MGIMDVFKTDKPTSLGDLLDSSDKTPSTSGVGSANKINVEASASAATLQSGAKQKKSKAKSGGTAFSFEDSDNRAAAQEQAELYAQIFKPEVWKGVMGAPGDVAFALTKKEHWLLSETEKETLAASGAATFRAFSQTDPKWIALTLFSFSLLTVYGGRLMKDMNDRRDSEKNKSIPLQSAVSTVQ